MLEVDIFNENDPLHLGDQVIKEDRDILQEIKDGTFELSISRLKKLTYDSAQGFLSTKQVITSDTLMGNLFETYVKGLPLPVDYVLADESVSPKIQEILKDVADSTIKGNLEMCRDEIIAAARYREYQSRWGDDALYNNLSKYQVAYDIIKSGKIVVKQAISDLAQMMARSLMDDAEFGPYLIKNVRSDFKDELTLRGSLYGINCIGILDRLAMFYDTKECLIIDFKGTSKNPLYAAKENRWDLQGSFYRKLLQYNIDNNPMFRILKDWKITVVFIVGRVTDPTNPVMLIMDDLDWDIADRGEEHVYDGYTRKTRKGLIDYLNLYKLHLQHGFKNTASGKVIRGIYSS